MNYFGFFLIFMTLSFPVEAVEPEIQVQWNQAGRIAYLKKALSIVREIGSKELEAASEYVYKLGQSRCRGSFSGLRVPCYLSLAEKKCLKSKSRYCRILYDLAAINRLGEANFISRRDRLRLRRSNGSGRAVISRALNNKYATLTAQFTLEKSASCKSVGASCFANELDKFCRLQSTKGNLPWQNCVGAVIWFIGQS